jgi:hypothetical protein
MSKVLSMSTLNNPKKFSAIDSGIGNRSNFAMTSQMRREDPNMLSWAQYLKESESSDSGDDFRDDSLNDADWDGQAGGSKSRFQILIADFTKQYNRQKLVIQNAETGIPSSQGPKRNPQSEFPSSIAHAAFTSRKVGDNDDSLQNLTRYAARINLKEDTSKYIPSI